MLDDLKMIHERDAHDALGIVGRQASQLEYAYDLSDIGSSQIDNIVYAGMGGSALAAQLAGVWPGCTLPFEIVRDYDLPKYVSERTLCIVASHSGNTEEPLSALSQAEDKKARIVVVTGGGALADIAREKGYPLALLPSAAQPRYALLSQYKAVLCVLDAAGVLRMQELQDELDAAARFLEDSLVTWRAEVPTADNPAKQLAQELMGRSIVMYSGQLLAPAAYKWKISFNENAKQVAWVGRLPESDHNEFVGWSGQPQEKPYAVIDLRSNLDHERVQKRFVVSERLLSGRRPAPVVICAQGDTAIQQLLWMFAFGDYVSLYLALLNGCNPVPIALVEKYKKELDQ